MNPAAVSSIPQTTRTAAGRAPQRSRLFYTGAAAILLTLTLVGFQQFYLRGQSYPGREIPPPIRTLIILHGAAMSAWILLFMTQPLLIVTGNRRAHMLLGQIGAVLAACIVLLGLKAGIDATRITPPELRIWGLAPKEFLAVPILSIVIFAGFVILGVWFRKRPAIHRPMMLCATLAAVPAAISRIEPISALYRGTIWETAFGPFFGTLVVAALFLVVKWALTRSFDRWYALGFAFLVASSAFIMRIAPTEAWDRFASLLLG